MTLPNQNKQAIQKTTPSGTDYTEYEIRSPVTDDLMLVNVPNTISKGGSARAVGFSHGRGSSRRVLNQYQSYNMPYVRDELIDHNYIVWAGDYGHSAWSGPAAVDKITDHQQWIDTQFDVTARFLIGESMGGALTALIAARGFPVDGHFFAYPSVSIAAAWERDQAGYLDEFVTAYGISPDGSDFYEVTAPHDPSRLDASEFEGIRALAYSGTLDGVVSYTRVVEPFFSKLANVSDNVTLVPTMTGHGDALNWPVETIRSFFDSLSPLEWDPVAVKVWTDGRWKTVRPMVFGDTGWLPTIPRAPKSA